MSKHHRRDGYWRVYHLAHTHELDALVDGIVSLVKENKPPVQVKKTRTRGKKPVHSREKLVCICLLMVILGSTFRDMQNQVPKLNLPWDEPYDHSTIQRAYQDLSTQTTISMRHSRRPLNYVSWRLAGAGACLQPTAPGLGQIATRRSSGRTGGRRGSRR